MFRLWILKYALKLQQGGEEERFLIGTSRRFHLQLGVEEEIESPLIPFGRDFDREGGPLFFDESGEFVPQNEGRIGNAVEFDRGIEQIQLGQKGADGGEEADLFFTRFEEVAQGGEELFFLDYLRYETVDFDFAEAVDVLVDLLEGDRLAQYRQFREFVAGEGEIVVLHIKEMKRRLMVQMDSQRLGLLQDDGSGFVGVGVEEADRSGIFAFERRIGPFDIVAIVAVDEGVISVFADQLNEGIKFSFGELFLMFNDEKILIAEE